MVSTTRINAAAVQEWDNSYFWPALVPETRNQLLADAIDALRGDDVPDFDGFVVRGVSGVVFGAMLALVFDRPLVVVRKEDDHTTHSSKKVEGQALGGRYIFVDDFISSGATVRATQRALEAQRGDAEGSPRVGCIVGILLYAGFPPSAEKVEHIREALGNPFAWVWSLVPVAEDPNDSSHADTWARPLARNPEVGNLEPAALDLPCFMPPPYVLPYLG